ncbi:MAG: hypothetical protein Q9214_007440, partial [Letrouitia sp. 1 TL-2023]
MVAQIKASGNGVVKKDERTWIIGVNAFNAQAIHHQGIKELWEKKWKFPNNINDGYSDGYTSAFFPICDELKSQAATHVASSEPHLASDLYLRIACLYRIARFPYIDSPLKHKAFELQKETYLQVAGQWADPIVETCIPHPHAQGREDGSIPIYHRVPSTASKAQPVPTVLLITGLDGHRPDNSQRTHEFLKRGWATVIIEIPGTADCPADAKDSSSPDRLWDSVFEWMAEQGVFDMEKVAAWGLSTGGFYAARIAHTHRGMLKGAVAQGMGCHYCFDEEWIEKADLHEYPFPFNRAMSQKFGYESVDEFKKKARDTFSLLENGVLDQASTRLLLIN